MNATAKGMTHRLRRLSWRVRSLIAPHGRRPTDNWKPAGGPVVVVAPHPDDEVIGCGGTLYRHSSAGDAVAVIYATRGEKSRGRPWLSERERGEVREKEARASCRVIGIDDIVFLDGISGEIAKSSSLVAALREAIVARRPRLIFVPHKGDAHPDHVDAYEATLAALVGAPLPAGCQLCAYEVWSPLEADLAVDITEVMRVKLRALKRHEVALDAFDYFPTVKGLAAYRSGTVLRRKGYAEAFALLEAPVGEDATVDATTRFPLGRGPASEGKGRP